MAGNIHLENHDKQAWALRAYAQSAMALVEAKNTGEMVERVCAAITETAPYVLAFIGLAEDTPGKPIRFAGGAGPAQGYLESLNLSWSEDMPEGRGPTGTSVRSGEPYIMGDSSTDPVFTAWREEAGKYGIRSSVTVPFARNRKNDGILMVYATEPHAFGATEVELFEHLGGAIGFAFAAFEDRTNMELERLRLQRLIEAAHVPILSLDARGHINMFNGAAERAFGYANSEVLGQTLDLLIPRDLAGVHTGHVHRFLTEPGPVARKMAGAREVWGQRKNGEKFPVEVAITRVDVGAGHFAMAIVHDLTERKAFELRLSQSAKMEALGQLAGGMAHDFNNLLTVIHNNIELLTDEFPPGSPQSGRLDRVTQAVQRGASLIDRMMSFSRTKRAPATEIDVRETLENLAMILQPTLGKSITIRVQYSARRCVVMADPSLFESSLLNLALNARDAMPDGGSLDFIIDRLPPPPETAKGKIRIVVRDTGTGIPEAAREKIFEPFYTTKDVGKGTGLGLATVKNFVEGAHGNIQVESVVGEGTSFVLSFPEV